MTNNNTNTLRRLMLVSVVYFLLALSVFTVVVYAWFTLTNTNLTALVSKVSEVEAEYEFYVYKDQLHNGSTNLTLIDNVCLTETDDLCYRYIPNPTTAHLIDGSVAPGERFSFAIKILNIGSSQAYLKLDFGGVESSGYDLAVNKIQTAFLYEVTQISYIIDGVESEDMKENAPSIYHSSYFSSNSEMIYPLVKNIPMTVGGANNSMVVIYFDLYFDPTIYGEDEFGVPYTNSNIFKKQSFIVEHVYMIITANTD
ncbi:hypothetical protein [Peloplasma aerotolerans]|uniref:Uncharacterized protein n=1 Tax=Peloplasma aerotolerans TaxID=3044389 RepID=A0AAW6U794_9MOLU|nr:hypothetical protein [Mariniplasma sp. M4Ah]MDI6452459.1 hypothetical protein [Mariniplasma sp. M4Ah]